MQRSQIELLHIRRDANSVIFPFRCDRELEHLFWPSRELVIYCSEGVRSDPSELAATFLLAMSPVAWMYEAEIKMNFPVPIQAKCTLQALGSFLSSHYGWAPVDVTAQVSAGECTSYGSFHSGLFFSGGVDSSVALSQLGERVDWLIHVSNFENLDSRLSANQRQQALDTTSSVANSRGCGWIHLRTNLAGLFKHNVFDDNFPPDCSFWLGLEHVHHLATAISVVRPRLQRVFLAGGFSELLAKVGSCAASSAFVDLYQWQPPFQLLHEDMPRQEKIEYLLDNDPEFLKTLRVCFSSGNGTCNTCRKCQATMLMVLSAGGDVYQTSFHPAILKHLAATVEELSAIGPEGHSFFNQALSGRMLQGSRAQRWAQLKATIRKQQRAVSSGVIAKGSAVRAAAKRNRN
jgi:hypothetical protein